MENFSAAGVLRRLVPLAVLAAIVLVSGCRTPPPPPPKDPAAIVRLSASSDVNPNSEGRPSPVHVQIFLLKDAGPFMGADFFSLVDKEQATLGDSVVQRLEQDLVPGEARALAFKVPPEARVIGVMAELANYRNAQWRAVATAPSAEQRRTKLLVIGIEKDNTTIALSD